jgi:hypothetical protein
MTATTIPVTSAAGTAEGRLRAVLALDAATSAAAGIVGLAATAWVADRLGVDDSAWIRLVSAGFLLFAAGVLAVARSEPHVLRRHAATVATANVAWVVVTAALVVAGAFSGGGTVLMAVMAVAVADLAALQLWFRSRMPR